MLRQLDSDPLATGFFHLFLRDRAREATAAPRRRIRRKGNYGLDSPGIIPAFFAIGCDTWFRIPVIRPQQSNASIDIHNEVENPVSVPREAWEVNHAICLRH